MRKLRISEGEYYHVYNRGVNKQIVFHDKADYARFLFLIIYFQSLKKFYNIGRFILSYLKWKIFFVEPKNIEEILESRSVELISFCIMPNHFHLILKELQKGGIAKYMQRILDAYTKYYNYKYDHSGHVFQGPYQVVHVLENVQLLHLSAYIHRNPRRLPGWNNRESEYEWSSYQDYTQENRFKPLLSQQIILDQFTSRKEYELYLQFSTAKE